MRILFTCTAFAAIATWGCKTSNSSIKSTLGPSESDAAIAGVARCDASVVKPFIEVPGKGYLTTAYANQSTGQLQVKWIDKRTDEACAKDSDKGFGDREKFPLSGFSDITLTIDGQSILVKKNPDVNYGYKEESVKCGSIAKLMDLQFSPQEKAGNCSLQLDTQDQYWYSITITPSWLRASKAYDRATDGPNLAFLKKVSQPVKMDQPLAPGKQLSAVPEQTRIYKVMKLLHLKYQKNDTDANQERNTCLRNGRAYEWLDLQSHFYCILPYKVRQCYSGKLVEGTATIHQQPTPAAKLGMLVGAMNKAHKDCFVTGPFKWENDFSAQDAVEIDKAFQHVMFVKQGVMDFSLLHEQQIINKFYGDPEVQQGGGLPSLCSNKKTTANCVRPPRLLDPAPWTSSQQRYVEIRSMQTARIKLGMAKQRCAGGGGNWDESQNACACGTNQGWNETSGKCIATVPAWQAFLATDNWGQNSTGNSGRPESDYAGFNLYSTQGFDSFDGNSIANLLSIKQYANGSVDNYKDIGPKSGLFTIPAKSVLAAMTAAQTKFESSTTTISARNACLNTGFATYHWSDLQIHYYCQHYYPRSCYSTTVSGNSGAPGNRRVDAYEKCKNGDSYGDNGFKWISSDPDRAKVFQYIMTANTYSFDPDQEEAIINQFYGIKAPGDFARLKTPEGRVECASLRPTRKDEVSVSLPSGSDPLVFANSNPNYGQHCVPDKKWKIGGGVNPNDRLSGRGY
jgi:hypothetical protein